MASITPATAELAKLRELRQSPQESARRECGSWLVLRASNQKSWLAGLALDPRCLCT